MLYGINIFWFYLLVWNDHSEVCVSFLLPRPTGVTGMFYEHVHYDVTVTKLTGCSTHTLHEKNNLIFRKDNFNQIRFPDSLYTQKPNKQLFPAK